MIATALAREVITTERPLAVPRRRHRVNPENQAEVVKFTWAALAGLSGDIVNNPPANLSADKASNIMGRMSRVLRNLQPMMTALGHLPPPQPARRSRKPVAAPHAQAERGM